jgi:hypothetical protein
MSDIEPPTAATPEPPGIPGHDLHRRRMDLIWQVVVFQFKLIADGLRDLLLSPISIAAAIMGLIAGGEDPDQYFRRVLKLGRRSETWLNLFGHHRRGPTADRLAEPLQHTLEAEFERDGWVRRGANQLNALLDAANARTRTPRDTDEQDHSETRSPKEPPPEQ